MRRMLGRSGDEVVGFGESHPDGRLDKGLGVPTRVHAHICTTSHPRRDYPIEQGPTPFS